MARKKGVKNPPEGVRAPLGAPVAPVPIFAPIVPACSHRGAAVKVGRFEVLAGGTRYLMGSDLLAADVIVPLGEGIPRMDLQLGQRLQIPEAMGCPWRDMSPPPTGFAAFLRESVIPELEAGKRLLAYCVGSHGRTGTFLACLIAILEPETTDPIAAVRERHCEKAVETREQVAFIFSLRGEVLPSVYEKEFAPRVTTFASPVYEAATRVSWPSY